MAGKQTKITLTVQAPESVELWLDEQGTLFIYRDLEGGVEADKFVEFVQHFCKLHELRNRLKRHSKKAKDLHKLRRIYELPDPRQG
jgi:hypothetical protein